MWWLYNNAIPYSELNMWNKSTALQKLWTKNGWVLQLYPETVCHENLRLDTRWWPLLSHDFVRAELTTRSIEPPVACLLSLAIHLRAWPLLASCFPAVYGSVTIGTVANGNPRVLKPRDVNATSCNPNFPPFVKDRDFQGWADFRAVISVKLAGCCPLHRLLRLSWRGNDDNESLTDSKTLIPISKLPSN